MIVCYLLSFYSDCHNDVDIMTDANDDNALFLTQWTKYMFTVFVISFHRRCCFLTLRVDNNPENTYN